MFTFFCASDSMHWAYHHFRRVFLCCCPQSKHFRLCTVVHIFPLNFNLSISSEKKGLNFSALQIRHKKFSIMNKASQFTENSCSENRLAINKYQNKGCGSMAKALDYIARKVRLVNWNWGKCVGVFFARALSLSGNWARQFK